MSRVVSRNSRVIRNGGWSRGFVGFISILTLTSACYAAQILESRRMTFPEKISYCAYPTVTLLSGGDLFCVFTGIDDGKTRGKAVIMGTRSQDHGETWSSPEILIDSSPDLDYDPSIVVLGSRILVTSTTVPPTHGQFISTSRTMAVCSEDNGKTWSPAYEIPMGHRYTSGKVHVGLTLPDGSALFGYSWDAKLEKGGVLKTEGDEVVHAGVMISHDGGITWKPGNDVVLHLSKGPDRPHAIEGVDEPAVVECADGSLYMLCRTGLERLYECRSTDGGVTWSDPVPSGLVSHNAPACLCGFRTGDREGILVVWCYSRRNRWPLCAAVSFDCGETWTQPREIANHPGFQSSYPSCVQAGDGRLVVVWQEDEEGGSRTIRLARFKPEWFYDLLPK